jgi:hypothetical protein
MILEIHDFINDEQLSFIKDCLNPYLDSNYMKLKDNSYRDGKTIAVSSINELSELDKFLHEKVFGSDYLLSYINKRYKPFYPSIDTGYEFHRYPPNNICHVHGDGEFSKIDSNVGIVRFASLVLHLNTPSNGGDLIFPELNKTVKTEAKKMVIFPPYNFAQHYTTPSLENRDVIVTWFAYDKIKVLFE